MRKIMKNALCLFIAMILFSLESCIVFARNTDNYAVSVQEETFRLLTALNIADESTEKQLKENQFISRGDFLAFTMRAVGVDSYMAEIYKEKAYFTDVTVAEENAGYINMAYERGYIAGYEQKRFFSQNNIDFTEASKIIISVLGYEKEAESTGGLARRICVKMQISENIHRTGRKNGKCNLRQRSYNVV